jgi:hypothetical protein
MRDQEIIGLEGAYTSIYTQTQELKEDKDKTEVGITGQPVPKPTTAKKQHELEKKRRMRKHLGKNVGGEKYSSDVNPYFNPRSVREEVLSYLLDEGFASDEKSAEAIANAMSEAWVESIVENRGMSYSGGKPGASGDGSRPKGITGGKTYQMPGWNDKDDKDDKKQVKGV